MHVMASGSKANRKVSRKSANPADDAWRVLMRNKANAKRLVLLFRDVGPIDGQVLNSSSGFGNSFLETFQAHLFVAHEADSQR